MTARWFRGNLHTHSTNSDGDSPPEVVVAWYRDAGYDFLALTDHDLFTDPDGLTGHAGRMLLIRGEELTSGDIHVNGLGISATIPHANEATTLATLQANVDAIRAGGGVPSVNHPNFRWALSAADLIALHDGNLFEIHNGGPDVNNWGRPGNPAAETLWDIVLSAGRRMIGVAVDDAHHFQVWGRPYSNPGRGWMCIRAERPAESELLTALEAGDCYASTGVALYDLDLSGDVLAVDIETRDDQAYTTTFIGLGGHVLDIVHGPSPRYAVTGREGYIRARIDDSDGLTAWTQPRYVA